MSGARPSPEADLAAEREAAARQADETVAENPPPPKAPDKPAPARRARQQAIEQAQGGAFASLTGTGDVSSGFGDENIYGGLLGNEAGEMNGGFGFGRSGFGPGGGGTGWGTIGTGRYGKIGHGSGTGSGYGVGGGRGGVRGRASAVPTVSIGQPNAQGDLDKAIIRRYIKRNIQKIQYCYEKELLAKPKLAGTVATTFFITPEGSVASASGSGVDPEVASCVANVIKGIEFPKPKSGGGVQVNYPFTFRPAGSDYAPPPPAPKPPAPKPPEAKAPEAKPPEAKPPAPPPPKPAAPEVQTPLRDRSAEIISCLRKQDQRYGALVVDLTFDASNKVSAATARGIASEPARACIAEVAKTIVRTAAGPATQRCPLAFGTQSVDALPSIEITGDDIRWQGKVIDHTAAVAAAPTWRIQSIMTALAQPPVTDGVALRGPGLVRPAPGTPMVVVQRVLASALAAGGDFTLGVPQGAQWQPIRAFDRDLPVVPLPLGKGGSWFGKPALVDESVSLSILVAHDRLWVGMSRVNEFQDIPKLADGKHDWAKLAATISDHKASAFFAERRDAELASDGDVPYSDLVSAVDALKQAGFVELAFVEPSALSARPQR